MCVLGGKDHHVSGNDIGYVKKGQLHDYSVYFCFQDKMTTCKVGDTKGGRGGARDEGENLHIIYHTTQEIKHRN